MLFYNILKKKSKKKPIIFFGATKNCFQKFHFYTKTFCAHAVYFGIQFYFGGLNLFSLENVNEGFHDKN